MMKSCLSVPKALVSLFFYSMLVVHFQSQDTTNELVHYRRASSLYWEVEAQEQESNFSTVPQDDGGNSNVNLSNWTTPFFIGAGLGTTGTTALYNAMCMMGFPSVHFRRSCIHPFIAPYSSQSNQSNSGILKNPNYFTKGNVYESSPRSNQHETRSDPLQQKMDSEMAKGVSAHRRLLRSWRSLRVCTRRSRQATKDGTSSTVRHNHSATSAISACENFTGIVDNLFHQATQVVKSELAFVTDTPYPFLVDFLWQIAKKHRPIGGIILTERDPPAWVLSRLRHHVGESDLMCFHPKNHHAFDLQKCLEQNQYSPMNTSDGILLVPSASVRRYRVQNLTFQHSEITGGNYYSVREKDQYRSFLLHSMKLHQDRIKHLDDQKVIVINLWNENLPTVADLANALWERMEPIVPEDILLRYKNEASPLQSIRD